MTYELQVCVGVHINNALPDRYVCGSVCGCAATSSVFIPLNWVATQLFMSSGEMRRQLSHKLFGGLR